MWSFRFLILSSCSIGSIFQIFDNGETAFLKAPHSCLCWVLTTGQRNRIDIIRYILCARGGMRRVRRVRGGMHKVKWACWCSASFIARRQCTIWGTSKCKFPLNLSGGMDIKSKADVGCREHEQPTNYTRICRADRSVRVVQREVDHKFILLRSFVMDRKFQFFFGYSKNINDSLHRVKFL
jgi:hypothetical protein